MKSILIPAFVITCAFYSCSKKSEDSPPAPKASLSFKMNGAEYTFDISTFSAGSPAAGNCRIVSAVEFGTTKGVQTNFPYWFDIRKTVAGSICATLIPTKTAVPYYMNIQDCNFQIPTVDTSGNALLSQEIFVYDKGTMSFSKSNCGEKKYFEINCLCTETANMCDLNGTFNLTFKNELGEMLTLTDGKFVWPSAFQ
ncbi:MAG TPA: hypothetical protein VLC28_16195 [Flavitalea sp.]|nr:hypothetical protein [Flavitalea sp.]